MPFKSSLKRKNNLTIQISCNCPGGETEKQLVLKIRRVHPDYGKEKIAVVLKRDHGQTMSESTVGRILTF